MRYRFGDYQLDTDRHALEHAGVPVKLERKVYQVLTYLVQHREHLVPRAELLEHVWPGVYVAEAAVTRCIAALRKAVGDDRERQQVIQTLHGQGYRFVAPVTVGDAPPPQASLTPIDRRGWPSATRSPSSRRHGLGCRRSPPASCSRPVGGGGNASKRLEPI
jgi:DNA-binding winged helix-turn-helix (wHTH) protein